MFFSRFEYSLKRTFQYLHGDASKAEPNWDRFGADHDKAFWADATDNVEAAVDYFRASPPRKQVVEFNVLAWSEPQAFGGRGPELVWLLLMIRTVRNNLFHGGKFQLPVSEPSRDSELLLHSLTILSACVALNRDVERWFEESF